MKRKDYYFNIPSELIKCPKKLKKYNFARIQRQTNVCDDYVNYDFCNNELTFNLSAKTPYDNDYIYTIKYEDEEVKLSLFLVGRLSYRSYSEEAIKKYKISGYKEALAIKEYVKRKIEELENGNQD